MKVSGYVPGLWCSASRICKRYFVLVRGWVAQVCVEDSASAVQLGFKQHTHRRHEKETYFLDDLFSRGGSTVLGASEHLYTC